MEIKTHDYGCECERCRAMIAAIIAKDADGNYFFSDAELLVLSMVEEHKNGT